MVRLEVDPKKTFQEIDGFGVSGAWWAQYVGGWSDEKRELVADRFFSVRNGIGLTQYRYNLGGGPDSTIVDPWRRAEGFYLGEGTYDWDRDQNARWFLKAALERGAEELIAFVNSPPAGLTRNGKTYGDKGSGSNLAPERYESFARYLVDVLGHFRSEGIRFAWISPVNEPQWLWDEPKQEGCHYEPDKVADLCKVVLKTMLSNGCDALLLVPEAGEWDSLYAGPKYLEAIWSEAFLSEHLPVVAVHSYWSTDENRAEASRAMERYPDQKVWMTEWTEMRPGRNVGMESAFELAETVHSDLTIAGVSAWQYWIGVSRYDYRDGLIYTDCVRPGDAESVIETKRLWALGQFSRYILPGSIRVAAFFAADSQLPSAESRDALSMPKASAYLRPDGRIVVVVINRSDRQHLIRLQFPAAYAEANLDVWRTSAAENMAHRPLVPLCGKASEGKVEARVDVSPRSITTYVTTG